MRRFTLTIVSAMAILLMDGFFVQLSAQPTAKKPFTFEGFVSSDILDNISKKFVYGNIPGIILRSHGQDLLLLRDPDINQKKTIRLGVNHRFLKKHLRELRSLLVVASRKVTLVVVVTKRNLCSG